MHRQGLPRHAGKTARSPPAAEMAYYPEYGAARASILTNGSRGFAMDFGPGIQCAHIEAPIQMKDFERFEGEFALLVKNRKSIYRAIPGGDTWPFFEPPREKILEYFLTLGALSLNGSHVYIDVASCLSLFPNYVGEITGAEVIRQDLLYKPGLHTVEFPRVFSKGVYRKTLTMACLGGDACAMPLPDSCADAIALHCSFEHFEGNADRHFAREALRLLRPGGRLLIIPFYCGNQFQEFVKSENAPGCQFHRFYDPPTFTSRVLSALPGPFHVEMRYYRNVAECDPSFYCHYSVCIVKDGE